MADLGELLGALMASVAHARRLADEETAAIAEFYRGNPLLEGMSIPRVRLPELQIEMPILLESYDAAGKARMEATSEIVRRLVEALERSAGEEEVALPEGFSRVFARFLMKRVERLRTAGCGHPEGVVRAMDGAFAESVRRHEKGAWLNPLARREILADLRTAAESCAMQDRGEPPRIQASIATAEVKEGASAATSPRLRVVLKEEGVEWTVMEHEGGATARTLTPE